MEKKIVLNQCRKNNEKKSDINDIDYNLDIKIV